MRDVIRVTIQIVRPSPDKPQGYLGASVSYPPKPDEEWSRGNDLADGPCNEATLDRIREDVLAVMEGYRKAFERDGHA